MHGKPQDAPKRLEVPSFSAAPTGLTGLTGLPSLAPPPFYLETEIRLALSRSIGLGLLTGSAILLAFPLLQPQAARLPVSLSHLFVLTLFVAAAYLGIRFMSFWAIWLGISRRYRASGTVNLAARGELPKLAYLMVMLIPICLCFGGCAVYYALYGAGACKWWLALALVVALSLRDIQAIRRLAPVNPSYWVKETRAGIDVLKRA